MSRLLLICIFAAYVNSSAVPRVLQSFIDIELVPDAIPVAPEAYLYVQFPNGLEVTEGNVLTPSQVQEQPTVVWDASPDQLYAVLMIDPDAPSRWDPIRRSVVHWMVGNIRGSDIASGDIVREFLGSGPREGTGLHRYAFLVYQQSGLNDYTEDSILFQSIDNIINISIPQLAENYNLGDPIAGNFYQCEYEG